MSDYSNEDVLINRIQWIAIIVLLIFICSGLRMGDSDQSQGTATQVLINKQNIQRLSDFYTFIPFGFCLGIVIYGITQIIFAKKNTNSPFKGKK